MIDDKGATHLRDCACWDCITDHIEERARLQLSNESLGYGGFAVAKINDEWRKLCAIEPRLVALEKHIRSIHDDRKDPWFCANSVWYGYGHWSSLKERMCKLAGWEAHNKQLRTQHAYDVAYDHLYKLLPNCRNCNCF